MTENTSAQAYLRTKVLTAPPEQLRLLLLDGAVKFARQGADGLRRKDYEASYNGLSQCRNIVVELLTTMKPEIDAELCERMRGLYIFMMSELVKGSFEKDAERVDSVIKLLEYERDTWALLLQKLADERTPSAEPRPAAMTSRAAISVEA